MTVFVYEWCLALGLGREESDPAHSLFREGKAMRDAVADDFRRVPGVVVVTLDAVGAADEERQFRELAGAADRTLVVAPEFDGVLEARCGWVPPGRLLGSSAAALGLCRDKLALAAVWRRAGVRTPHTELLRVAVGGNTPGREAWAGTEAGPYTDDAPGVGAGLRAGPTACRTRPDPLQSPPPFGVSEDRLPAVIKPRDGAGSTATYFCADRAAFLANRDAAVREWSGDLIVQEYVAGRPASVAFLIGPARTIPLLPTFQLLSTDDRFRYEGGELPIPPDLAERAIVLGRQAVAAVPGLLDYVGVDLILGGAADGSGDYAIEINPRLTTSYVGLRALADFNLAEAMLRVSMGGSIPAPRWRSGPVRFRPDGTTARINPDGRENF